MMKLIFQITLIALCVMMGFASCSKDEPTIQKPLANIINRVDIYNGSTTTQKLVTTLRFAYDDRNRLVEMSSENPLEVVTYIYYSNDSLSYTYLYETSTTAVSTSGKSSCKLKSGRVAICKSAPYGDFTYEYDKNGRIVTARSSKNLMLSYVWNQSNVSRINVSNPLFDTEYIATTYPNQYNLDMNAILDRIDERSEFPIILNTYASLINILGERSKNILKKQNFSYDFSFDEKGRVKNVEIQSPVEVNGGSVYRFVFEYK